MHLGDALGQLPQLSGPISRIWSGPQLPAFSDRQDSHFGFSEVPNLLKRGAFQPGSTRPTRSRFGTAERRPTGPRREAFDQAGLPGGGRARDDDLRDWEGRGDPRGDGGTGGLAPSPITFSSRVRLTTHHFPPTCRTHGDSCILDGRRGPTQCNMYLGFQWSPHST